MIRIAAIGSKNPAKTGAAHAVLQRAFQGCEVVAVDVPSGVRAQPVGERETEQGARNRAAAALAAVDGAALGVGLEGGIDERGHLINCAAVVHRDGRAYAAWGVRFALPPSVVQRVLQGQELGHVMDEVSGLRDSKSHAGAVGILTNGLLDRTQMWRAPLSCALAPLLHPELYGT